MRIKWVFWGVITSLVTVSTAGAENLNTHSGHLFDISPDGTAMDGLNDAYDGCYRLTINGANYSGGHIRIDDRKMILATANMGSFQVRRTILVPDEANQDYARYIDFIQNTSEQPAELEVQYSGNLGSDGGTNIWATSSGDQQVTAEDFWFGTDDTDGSSDPTLAHAFHHRGSSLQPESQQLQTDNITVNFTTTLAEGETIAFMIFAFQGPNQNTIREQVETLFSNLDPAIADVPPEERRLIVNWPLGSTRWSPAPLGETLADRSAMLQGLLPQENQNITAPIVWQRNEEHIIYQAQLQLAVRDVEAQMQRAINIAEEFDGYINSQENETLVLRIPAQRFREALAQLEGVGDVLNRRIHIQELTEQIRDIRVRLETAETMFERLSLILRRTQNVQESLAIERELQRLGETIGILRSILEELEEQLIFSTITIHFQSTSERETIPDQLFQLPFDWLNHLGLSNLLTVD